MDSRAGSILQVIERQFRRRQIVRDRKAVLEPETALHWPVITISREFGARGEALGALIAERSGFALWDGELVHAVAQESGADEVVLRSLDEHRRNEIAESIHGVLLGGEYMASEYLRRLSKVIRAVSVHGASVVVGRGAQYLLASDEALRVRVVCLLEDRIRGYATRQGIDESRAREQIERSDSERRQFIRQSYSKDPSNAADYDLVVNTGTLAFEKACDVVLVAYEAKFGRRPLALEKAE
jgi:Cytidylate kinase-like family